MAARPRLPLGRLLLEAGILSDEQLGAALAEQQQTDRPLGEILVERGFVSRQLVASALAEQHGGVLKTEYGVAVGLSPSPTPGPPIGSLVGQPLVTGGSRGAGNRSAASTALAPLRGAEPVHDEPEETRSLPALSLVPPAEPAPPAADLQELKAALERADELAAASDRRLAELGEELERLVAVRQEAEALLASLREAQAPSEPFVSDRHYLFIPSDNEKGYDFAERPGPAPEVGEEVDVALPEGEVRFRVARLGVARIPGARMACAYVERI